MSSLTVRSVLLPRSWLWAPPVFLFLPLYPLPSLPVVAPFLSVLLQMGKGIIMTSPSRWTVCPHSLLAPHSSSDPSLTVVWCSYWLRNSCLASFPTVPVWSHTMWSCSFSGSLCLVFKSEGTFCLTCVMHRFSVFFFTTGVLVYWCCG